MVRDILAAALLATFVSGGLSWCAFNSPNKYNYKVVKYIGANDTWVPFVVRSCGDVHIALHPTKNVSSKFQTEAYEIVLGGWGDQKSCIRKKLQGSCLASAKTPGIVSPRKFKYFWISWEDGHIKVGRGNQRDQHMFMDWKDKEPYDLKSLSVSSWPVVPGAAWRFPQFDKCSESAPSTLLG
ncbi:uncharacterized protein 5 [Lingula anatina]|uniref:Uncharacterized protein 5 n=1 Tax=Lingula anatina TaxID=7574 RepID=A0A1S3HAE8_LINAN|nr:uncharacterized protein 5 [Lingula anatina]|eukprot:XP_013382094.1 uncharacterized protein 5 [Lingula anatina]